MKRKQRIAVTVDGVEVAAEYLNELDGKHLVRVFEGLTSSTDKGLRVVSQVTPVEFELPSC